MIGYGMVRALVTRGGRKVVSSWGGGRGVCWGRSVLGGSYGQEGGAGKELK